MYIIIKSDFIRFCNRTHLSSFKKKEKQGKNSKLICILTSSVNNAKCGSELNDIAPNNAFW